MILAPGVIAIELHGFRHSASTKPSCSVTVGAVRTVRNRSRLIAKGS
jgi:hypothetical protein